MSWENRGGKGQYYTWTVNFAARRRRVYLGKAGDPVAEMAAAYDALHRINVELQERKWADEITKFRNAPVKAGIDAAFEELVRMFSGVQPFHTAEPEPSTPKAQPTDATPR